METFFMRSISVLGSTGSVGTQSLDVIEKLGYRVSAIAANRSIDLLEKQARKFMPEIVAVYDEAAAEKLKSRLSDTSCKVLSGMEGLIAAAEIDSADTVITAVMGMIGLRPTMAAIHKKKRIGLANKETLVCAGRLVTAAAKKAGKPILPVDSEHSAIFQCLQGRTPPKKLLLTASGGPFRDYTVEEMVEITPMDALRHPNWRMGPKITVDSATLMNKGLEFIEAMWLFGVTPDQIEVLIHPQSVVHSAVEFPDGAVIAQLGTPDMRLPIQLALTWPERKPSPAPALDLTRTAPLTFAAPDLNRFPCLRLAMELADHTETADCAVMNAANEVAVRAFLAGDAGFLQIYETVAAVTEKLGGLPGGSLEEIIAADEAARRLSKACLSSIF